MTCFAVAIGLVSVAGRLLGWPGARLLLRQRQIPDLTPTVAERIAEGRKRRLDARSYSLTTEYQDETKQKAFYESVDQDAVCALATRIRGDGVPCRVVGKFAGGFNFCFFVQFDDAPATGQAGSEAGSEAGSGGAEKAAGTQWVVRLPIGHAVDRPWDKVVSEVATMRYLARKTRIPIARVHADKPQHEQIYVVLDFVPGTHIDKKKLVAADPEQRASFYMQLVDILAELRPLEFSQIGSYQPVPGGSDDTSVTIRPLLSMSDNVICLPPPPIWTSASVADFMEHTYAAVLDFFYAPVGNMKLENVRRELFALEALKPFFMDAVTSNNSTSGAQVPCVLNHFDLRSTNIIVDEQFRIQGVIDWEFTGTVPLPLFVPPSWVIGHDPKMNDSSIHAEFRQALHIRARERPVCAQLEREWYGDGDGASDISASTNLRFCIAHIMRKPTHATEVFEKFLRDTPAIPEEPEERDARLAAYFESHPELEAEAQRRIEQSREYTAYLAENGIFETFMDRFYALKKQAEARLGRPLY
ncbi:hypothetical protein SCUCBS95973_009669 [Sporothrix curviconia]|uniref:Aminoglycoside phosphotransferase domain-containing protein n=1 Tax=Sporothrix curviconia TaxID=1260050 RepID=A0ABP0CXG3_9PEZI